MVAKSSAKPILQGDSEPVLVAVDNGHYGIKVYSGVTGKKGYIESRCRIGGSISTELIASASSANAKELVFTTEGQEFTTGSLQATPTTFSDYPLSPINRVLVHSALHQNGFTGANVSLVLGLPYSQFYDPSTDSGKNEKLKGGMEENIKVPVSHEELSQINVVDADTVPEGMAAWFSYIMAETVNDNGQVSVKMNQERASETVVLIDIGGQTTEVVTVVNRAAQRNYSSSFPLGSHRIIEDLRRYIMQASKVLNISDSKVKQALKDGQVKIGNQTIDCTKVIQNSKAKLVHEIKAQVDTLTNDIEGDIDRRLLLGGTSLDLQEQLSGWKGAELMESALYANAIGGYLYAKYLR